MNQINIKINILENKIKELEALQEKCGNMESKPNAVCGSGTVVDVLHQIDEAHAGLVQDFEELLGNTILFLKNVSQSMTEADSQIADGLNK